jgi:hypothetical protein
MFSTFVQLLLVALSVLLSFELYLGSLGAWIAPK